MISRILLGPTAAVLLASAALGCTADDAVAPVGYEEPEITSRDGYSPIPIEYGVYHSVAVVGDTAFVGDTYRTIDLVDLRTMKKTGSLPGRIVNESMSASGGKVVACGLRDDSPLDPFGQTPADRSLVITVIDGASRAVDGEVKLGIERYLATNPRNGNFVDEPRLSCRFDSAAKKLTVTFSQKDIGREVMTFPMPALGTTFDYESVPGAKRTRLDRANDDVLLAAAASERGITYAAGGYGLRRLAPGATRPSSLRAEGREHMVDLEIRGGRIYAVDFEGALVVADEATGQTIERVAIADDLHAIALTPKHVVVMGRHGIFVAKDRWATHR
jgi:hypothetical protein